MALNPTVLFPAIMKSRGDDVMYGTLDREYTWREIYEQMNQLRNAWIDLG